LPAAGRADTAILNVSYDVSRELYKDINPAFIADWKAKGGEGVTVNQSHGGSSKQAMSVASGLEADVVTMNQAPDIDILVERGGYVAADWRTRFPHEATPYTTITVFLVRKGNPAGIKDWDDLAKPGRQVIVPNPKTSGNGRYTYLAAWGYALRKYGGDAEARNFVTKLFANVPVLDGGGRGATTTFTQRRRGRRAGHLRERSAGDISGARHRQIRCCLSLAQHRGCPARGPGRQGRGQARHAQARDHLSRVPVLAGGPGDHRQARLSSPRRGGLA
jgi:sulfate/thiosulfate-binding protein